MVELNAEQKEFIRSKLKSYLEEDDMFGLVKEIKTTMVDTNHDAQEVSLVSQVCTFLYELGVPILEGCKGLLPEFMFYNTSLSEIEIPSNVKMIGALAFESSSLVSVVLNEGLTTICRQAFQNSLKLESINFPKSLKVIQSYAFTYCPNLTEIRLTGDTKIHKDAFLGTRKQPLRIFVPKDVWETENSSWYHVNEFGYYEHEVVPY